MAFTPKQITKELDMANLAKHNDNYNAIKTELDTQATAAATHTAAQTAHGSTSDASPGKIMQRDLEGRAKVAAPAAADDIARKAEVDAVQTRLDMHKADGAVHLSASDRAKLDGIEDGAQPNQNAFAQVNDVVAASESDALTIEGGTGITITTNPTSKKVIVTATGDTTPGAHGSSHNIDGADPIPDLVMLRDRVENIKAENILDNGDFDVWQKGTSATNLVGIDFIADRWMDYRQSPSTTPLTVTSKRLQLKPNEITGCKYCYRVEWDAVESSNNNDFRHMIYQVIDGGYSRYVRDGNKITIKFLARTNIPGKRVAVNMHERFLSSNIYNLNGASFEVGTDWTEVTYTWDLQLINDPVTTDEDSLSFQIYLAWGDQYASRFEGVPESYRAAGWVDIANVRVVEGVQVQEVYKKSFNEELANCKRYFQKSWDYKDAAGSAVGAGWDGGVFSSNEDLKTITITTNFEVEMFSTPTIVLYDTAGSKDKISTKNRSSSSTFGVTPNPGVTSPGTKNFKVMHEGPVAGIAYHWAASIIRS